MPDLPTGSVTFLFTDVEGSTRLWEAHPEAMRQALIRHDLIIEALVEEHGGTLVRPRGEGDSRFAVFSRASDAVAASCAIQRSFQAEPWPTERPLRVRIALHTGEADLRDGDYYGSAVNRCARLRGVGHGGQVLLSSATADQASDGLVQGEGLLDLGWHRLKDLSRPEHVYQLVHPDLESEFPPLQSLSLVSNNLPQQLTTFVGREKELAQIVELLERARLVTLTGAGGSGKTRLALQAAAEISDQYSDGVWFADLTPLSDPGLVTQTVASAIGIKEAPGEPLLATLLRGIGSRALLLVLDNCEHLIHACAHLVDALLRSCPNIRLLLTSREVVRVEGETVWRVPPLTVHRLGETPVQSEAVRLFVDRAAAVLPGFGLTPDNMRSVEHICHQVDGLPLAIELASARVNVLSPHQIAERLDDRFRLLTVGSRVAPRHHQTLRALVDWSYALLSEEEKLLLQRLTVFAGGWTVDAAEAVCASAELPTADVLDLLGSLVDKSLVVAEPAHAEMRYRLLDTLRQYAAERLAEADAVGAIQERHAVHYAGLVERLEPLIYGPDQIAALQRLEAEHNNIRAVLSRTATVTTSAWMAAELAAGVSLFWFLGNYFTEARHWLDLVLSMELVRGTPAGVRCLAFDGFFAASMGDQARSIRMADRALSEARLLNDPYALAWSLSVRCAINFVQGNATAMEEDARAGTSASLAAGWQWGAAICNAYLGRSLLMRRMSLEALGELRVALERSRQMGNPFVIALALSFYGAGLGAHDDYDGAVRSLAEALRLFRELGSLAHQSRCLVDWAAIALRFGRTQDAASALADGLRLARGLGQVPYRFAQLFTATAQVASTTHQLREAAFLLSAADALRTGSGTQVPPESAADEAGLIDLLRAGLGEAEFERAWTAGQGITHEDAVALAQKVVAATPATIQTHSVLTTSG